MTNAIITKLYYSIGEVAKMFNINTSKLRFWEKEFDFLRPHKNQHGDRKYTEQDIEVIRTIYHLVEEKGYTLEGVRQKMKNNKDEMEKKTKVFTRWIRSPWTFEVHRNPVIDILGRANKIYLNKNLIHMKKTDVVEKNTVVNTNVKFCFNCGTENKGFKFCPNCGQNLQQA